jgi:hypothetical protein
MKTWSRHFSCQCLCHFLVKSFSGKPSIYHIPSESYNPNYPNIFPFKPAAGESGLSHVPSGLTRPSISIIAYLLYSVTYRVRYSSSPEIIIVLLYRFIIPSPKISILARPRIRNPIGSEFDAPRLIRTLSQQHNSLQSESSESLLSSPHLRYLHSKSHSYNPLLRRSSCRWRSSS